MTFAARTLGYLSSGAVVSNSLSCNGVSQALANNTAKISFFADGTITYQLSGLSSGSTAWITPTGGTPGNSYWIKFTRVSGIVYTGPTSGVVYPLSSTLAISVTAVTSGQIRQSAGTVDIYSDASGTTRVGGGNWTLSAEWLV